MIIEIESLKKTYGKQIVLDNINYSILKPKIIGLVAPNGSGKTTLFDIICNLERSDSGTIKIFNKPNNSSEIFNLLSYMQDNKILYPDLTALDHLLYVSKCHKIKKSDLYELVDTLNMRKYLRKTVKNYSLGMKQTLLLAMSVIGKPKILLLDEPLNGLDVTTCSIFRKIINNLHISGTTVIISSHNLEEIEKLTEYVLFLNEGRLVSKTDDDIIEKLKKESISYQFVLDCSEKFLDVLQNHYSFKKLTNYKIEMNLTEIDKINFIEFCKKNDSKVLDVQSKYSTTYQIYKMLFER